MQDKRCFTYPWFVVLDNIVFFSDDCTSAWQLFWYEKNLQGDVVAVYDNNGVKQVSYTYDAWGNCTTTTHVSGTAATYNPIRYRSYYYDREINLYYLGARWYSARFHRFMSPDDISYLGANGDLNSYNFYAYCSNNPVMYVDPTGHFVITLSVVLWAAIIGGTVGAITGAIYGGFTAAANEQNVWDGVWIGALTGGFMGAGAGVASLFIAPVITGGSVIVGGTTIVGGTALTIGCGLAFGTGAIGGAASDMLIQKMNNEKVTNVGSVFTSALQWGIINTAGTFLGSIGGPLSNLETALITCIFNHVTCGIGLIADAIRESINRSNQENSFSFICFHGL